jgi:hypothetical protein
MVHNGQHHHLVAYHKEEEEAGLRPSQDLSLIDSVGQLIWPMSLSADAFIIANLHFPAMGQEEKPTSSACLGNSTKCIQYPFSIISLAAITFLPSATAEPGALGHDGKERKSTNHYYEVRIENMSLVRINWW